MINFNAVGRLANNVVPSSTKSGKAMAKFTFAVPRPYSSKRPEGAQDADFMTCVVFGNTAEFVQRNFRKGSRAHISGAIRTDKYEKDGKTKYSMPYILIDEIDIIDFKSKDATAAKPTETASTSSNSDDDWGEDIPF